MNNDIAYEVHIKDDSNNNYELMVNERQLDLINFLFEHELMSDTISYTYCKLSEKTVYNFT